MPHVQIVGSCPLAELCAALAAVTAAAPPLILKTQDAYLSPSGDRLLLEALVVEGYLRQGFFLQLRADADGVLIRCHPLSPVQRTDGVKRLIALVAQRCLAHCPGSRVGHTNLQAYL